MTNEQQQVRQWMIAYEQEAPPRPKIPDLPTRQLRARLILEEAFECIEALGCHVVLGTPYARVDAREFTVASDNMAEADLVKLADGLADLHYVAYCGTAVACGIDMEHVFAEVHRSNINKFWTNTEVAKVFELDLQLTTQNSIGAFSFSREASLKATKVSKTHWLVKDSAGKVIKSPSWKSPDIAGAIAKGTPQ